jgi:uncharacterized DUF497 family protein
MREEHGSFVWNTRKELVNIKKHGINFTTAAKVFLDPKRKIFLDYEHSVSEERYFCIGKVGGRVITVRFTYRQDWIRIYGAGYWRKGKRYYEEE